MTSLLIIIIFTSLSNAGNLKCENYVMIQKTFDSNGKMQEKNRLIISERNIRVESLETRQKLPDRLITIYSLDDHKIYFMLERRKVYYEVTLPLKQFKRLKRPYEKWKIKEEKSKCLLVGHSCREFLVESIESKEKNIHRIWMCEKYDMPLKIVTNYGTIIETTHLEDRVYPSSQFKVPEDFIKVAGVKEALSHQVK